MSKNSVSTTAHFPSQAISSEEMAKLETGRQVGRAIENEWFRKEGGSYRYFKQRNTFNELRLYARGEQSTQKYKDELSVNGDLSYLNLDWKPVPIIPKFVDIVVNGISERPWEINCYSQDPTSQQKRTAYVESVLHDMRNKELFNVINDELGVNMFQNDMSQVPQTEEELELHMQLDFKESIEIAEEEAISNVFALNKYEWIKRRLDYDLTVLGIACVEHTFNTAEGIVINYRDPADVIYSYTESPYCDDIYYQGVIDKMSISELKKNYPYLTKEDIAELEGKSSTGTLGLSNRETMPDLEEGYVYVMRYYYKTYQDQVYKIKETSTGALKAIKKTDQFNPPKDQRSRFEKSYRSIEVLYEGAKVVGHDVMLEWKLAENMTRPKSDTTRVHFPMTIIAPRMYRGVPESLVSRMISFADAIQIIHLKLQQVISKVTPDGVFIDANGIAEVELKGVEYDAQEALNMFLSTGSVIGTSTNGDGEFNHGQVPIKEINHSGGNAKISALIAAYNQNLQMIRDVTGLNEARDGSTPDRDTLVGLQKLAAANSNTATRHIIDGGLYLTLLTAEGVSLRISDVLDHSNTRESFINSLGKFNVATLTEIRELNKHDFGIYINLSPDEEQKQILEQNIQVALSREQISLDDAIDVRKVNNLSLANQLLKVRRRKKEAIDRQQQLENIQAQAEANAQSAERAAAADVQKEQAIAGTEAELEKLKNQLEIEKMNVEVEKKKELMYYEFQINRELKNIEKDVIIQRENIKEDRKDERTKIQATQQSEMISQRQMGSPPKNFESSGNDTLGDGFSMEQFAPR